jgi:dUTP pyrophosphatase
MSLDNGGLVGFFDRSSLKGDYSVLNQGGRMALPKLEGDVGHNLPAVEEVIVRPGEFAFIHTGAKLAMPDGVWGLVLPRSSTNMGGKLISLTGVIDTGYRGELGVMVHNVSRPSLWSRIRWLFLDSWRGKLSPGTVRVLKDQSLAQMVFFIAVNPLVESVEELPAAKDGGRGDKRFGSTGHS